MPKNANLARGTAAIRKPVLTFQLTDDAHEALDLERQHNEKQAALQKARMSLGSNTKRWKEIRNQELKERSEYEAAMRAIVERVSGDGLRNGKPLRSADDLLTLAVILYFRPFNSNAGDALNLAILQAGGFSLGRRNRRQLLPPRKRA